MVQLQRRIRVWMQPQTTREAPKRPVMGLGDKVIKHLTEGSRANEKEPRDRTFPKALPCPALRGHPPKLLPDPDSTLSKSTETGGMQNAPEPRCVVRRIAG